MANLNDTWKLSSFYIYTEGKQYNTERLTAEYMVTDKHGNTDKVTIDGVPLRLSDKPLIDFSMGTQFSDTKTTVDLGFGELKLDEKTKITEERIVTATKKMTVEEIEKALGYKVEIVSEKEEQKGDCCSLCKEKGGCSTCKHRACTASDEPCLSCKEWSNWERGK